MNESLYGRKWELKIECKPESNSKADMLILGQDGITAEGGLRCTFDIDYYAGINNGGFPFFAEFNIFNATEETAQKVIKEGSRVYFSAGYSKGNYGLIFGGTVFQSYLTRENVVDRKLTILCADGEKLFRDSLVSLTLNKEYTDMSLLNATAAYGKSPISVGRISSQISEVKKPRGTTLFGTKGEVIRTIVRSNNAQTFTTNDELQVVKLTDKPKDFAIAVNYETGLVGAPQQIDKGVAFRSLLNPLLVLSNPLRQVKLDMSGINFVQQKIVFGQFSFKPLPSDGYFLVIGVRHIGDTRGNEWYTDVAGCSLGGLIPLQLETMTLPEMLNSPDFNPR